MAEGVVIECLSNGKPAGEEEVRILRDGISYLYTLLARRYSKPPDLNLVVEGSRIRIETDDPWTVEAVKAILYRMEEKGSLRVLEVVE